MLGEGSVGGVDGEKIEFTQELKSAYAVISHQVPLRKLAYSRKV